MISIIVKMKNIILCTLFVLFLISCTSEPIVINETVEDNTTIFDDPMYLKAEEYTVECSEAEDNGNYYYEKASQNYINNEWQLVILNCVTAREYYSDAASFCSRASGYYDIIEAEGDEQTLLELNVELAKVRMSENYNMYEACEYFEISSFYYSEGDYISAGLYMDIMTEKIISHDNDIKNYSIIYSKIIALEDKFSS